MGYDTTLGYQKRWQKEGSSHLFTKSSNPHTFLFYGAVAKGHKSKLIKVTMGGEAKGRGSGGFDSASFIKVMRKLWREVKGWYPQGQSFKVLDNGKQHVSKQSKAALKGMRVPLLDGFAPQSYDLNLIEVVSGHLQQQLGGRRFKKKEKYEQEIHEACARAKHDTIDKLVDHHMQQVPKHQECSGRVGEVQAQR